MEFRLLGPLEVWEDGRPLSLGGTKQRALLGEPILVTRPPGYMLRVDFERLDLHRYERLLEEGRRALATHAPDHALQLSDALSLLRGPPLGDLAFEPFRAQNLQVVNPQEAARLWAKIDREWSIAP